VAVAEIDPFGDQIHESKGNLNPLSVHRMIG
jgi:hypothetical protein